LLKLSKNHINNWWLLVSFLLVTLIVWNTNILFQILKQEERTKMELWATAQQELIENNDLSKDYGSLLFDVLQKTGNTPIIQSNSKGKIIDFKNIQWNAEVDKDSSELYKKLELLKKQNTPITIQYKNLVDQKLYYGDSNLLKKLQYYPIALLLIIFLFATVLYFFFKTSRISEQNRLWVGMAKETAHQIGTPLTSLMGWLALIKERGIDDESIEEMGKDIDRLKIITDRFSKVGSFPKLEKKDIVKLTLNTINYLKKRSSHYLEWKWSIPDKKIRIPINSSLFSWTLENIINNSIDAMKGKGNITIILKNEKKVINIIIIDTGKGIANKNISLVFNPGFTTKKRGWGLGLSLAKRIIEDYHKGQLRIKDSEINKGTTFEIILRK
tara:strand:- start:247 stop:1401 length:1155 start_codon:yes stop_codon:yes gene_type:complete